MSSTLNNFFGNNKLYLKSNQERGILGPKHIRNNLDAHKQDATNRRNVMDANLKMQLAKKKNKNDVSASEKKLAQITRHINNCSSTIV